MISTLEEKAEDAPVLSLRDIASREKVSETAVYRWINSGILVGGVPQKLLAYKVGKAWRIWPEWLEDFKRRTNPDAWQQLALEQERQRREARKDRARLDRLLGEAGRGGKR